MGRARVEQIQSRPVINQSNSFMFFVRAFSFQGHLKVALLWNACGSLIHGIV